MDLEFYDKKDSISEVITARLEPGQDFHEALHGLLEKYDVQYGYIPTAIGMFEECTLGVGAFRDGALEYAENEVSDAEIMLSGSVFQRDGKPFVHVHGTVSAKAGEVFMGHLVKGKIKVMCEVVVVKLA